MKNKLLPAAALGTAFVLVFSFLFFCGGMTAFEAAASAPSITLEKTSVQSGEEIVISTADSKVKVAVIPTNEELAICRETVALVK